MEDIARKQNMHAHHYRPETAGRLMTEDVPTAKPGDSIGSVRDELLQRIHRFETINYVYVVNGRRRLAGVLSIKDLLRREPTEKISDVMKKDVITAKPHSSVAHVAHLAAKHNIKAVPVTSKDEEFLGVVPSDEIIAIFNRQFSRHLHSRAGISQPSEINDNILSLPIWTSFRHRIPWLLAGLIGGIAIAGTIDGFARILENNLILAAFIPLIVYTSDAVGSQMNLFIARDLAIHPLMNVLVYAKRQFIITFLIAGTLAALLFLYAVIVHQDIVIASILASALIATILSSIVTGLLIPYMAIRMRYDPANVSGPIATIIQDFLSVLIYFSIASFML